MDVSLSINFAIIDTIVSHKKWHFRIQWTTTK